METNGADNVMMMDKGKEKEGADLYLVKRPRVFLFNAHLSSPIPPVTSSPPPQLAHPPTPWQPPPAAQSHVSTHLSQPPPPPPQQQQQQPSSLLSPSSSSSPPSAITTTTNRIESSPSPPQSLPQQQPSQPPPQPPQSMHSISSILSPQPTSSSPPRSISDPSTASSSSSQGSTSPAGVTPTTTTGTTSNPSATTMQSGMGGPKVEIMYQDGRMVPSSRPKRMRRGPVEPKMRRVQPLEKDPVSGEYKLPARVGILTVHSLGRVVPLPTYHNDRYIWPPGFKVSRYV